MEKLHQVGARFGGARVTCTTICHADADANETTQSGTLLWPESCVESNGIGHKMIPFFPSEMRTMAKKPAFTESSTSDSSNSESPSGSKEMSSKIEAFEEAIEALGADAKPLALQEWIRQRYGVTLKTSLLSTYKSTWLRQQESSGPPPGRSRYTARSSEGRTARPAAPSASAPLMSVPLMGGSGLNSTVPTSNADRDRDATLRDIRVLREMLHRVGESQLKEMLDLLGVR